MRKTLNIGKVNKIIFFGGSDLLVELVCLAVDMKFDIFVFCVRRHLLEKLRSNTNLTLSELLKKKRIPFQEADDINRSPILNKIVTDTSIGIGLGEAYSFNRKTISLFKERLFDLMMIDLPRYRGGAHFTWQILHGDKTGCWNIQIINEKMIPGVFDSGEIALTRKFKIPERSENPENYFNISDKQAKVLFKDFLSKIINMEDFKLKKVNEKNSLFFPRLHTESQGFINWSWSGKDICRFINGFSKPYKGASTFIDNRKVFLRECSLFAKDGSFHPFTSGLILRISDKSIFVASRDACLRINEIYDEYGKPFSGLLKTGQRMYTPLKKLEEAMLFTSEYDQLGLVRRKGKEYSV